MKNVGKLAIAFNGGKESLVVLHMHLSLPIVRSNIIVFRVQDAPSKENRRQEFPEILDYISMLEKSWGFETEIYTDMKLAIVDLKSQGCDRFILGNRRSDPHSSHLEYETVTDEDWPIAIRVFPLLNWSYSEVWKYIRRNALPVCKLYETGYTSIGHVGNTFPNHSLMSVNENRCVYRHAETLVDESTERHGRIKSSLPLKSTGTVVRGNGNGKKLGFATANLNLIEPSNEIQQMTDGVYYGTCSIRTDDKSRSLYTMVMSIGTNPSVEILNTPNANKTYEVHIIEKTLPDFYGEVMDLTIVGYIRPMFKYTDMPSLISAIQTDVFIAKQTTLRILHMALTN